MSARFTAPARLLHWVMAVLILAMLFIGVGMVSTVSTRYPMLLAIHRPLGICILVLALVRLAWRLGQPAPPLPADLPAVQRAVARLSHYLLYALMIALPLVGWGMLSAQDYPIVLAPGLHLPPILPADPMLYANLRAAHEVLAYLFFAAILGHAAAALMHGLVRRDGVFSSMTPWPTGSRPLQAPTRHDERSGFSR
ncbi:cytochrome b [Geminicoccus roseus]|uniref:cytochrome b n=1 Tax=Geminicoccus roseus TaxID=404900 RepID=UPI00040C86DB|nr:cytochrome b/b6 domain-containing protein [Geminicoccus roseus]